jgi:hypothetical protein
MVATAATAKSQPGTRLSFDERAATSVLVLSRIRTTSQECWMTKSKLVASAILFLLANPSAGFAAGGSAGRGGVGYGGTGTGTGPDTVGADVVNIPDMAIGGPPALDVTKDLPATAPTTAPQRMPGMKPSSRSMPPQ